MDYTHVLSPQNIESYRRDGYLVPKLPLPEKTLSCLQQLALQLIKDNPSVRGGIRRLHLSEGVGSESSGADNPWLAIATHPLLLDIVEQLIGPDIILWTSTLFYKPFLEVGTRWHRDGCYYPIKPLATITVWIAVFDVTRDNAGLRIIPKSHTCTRTNVYDANEHKADAQLDLSEEEESRSVDVELKAGEFVLFDVSTVHGSWPSRTLEGRIAYAVRYFPAACLFDRKWNSALARSTTLILVRGDNKGGNRLKPETGAGDPLAFAER